MCYDLSKLRKSIRDRIAAAPAISRGAQRRPGGLARAAKLSPERRREIATKASRAAHAGLVIVRRHPLTHLPTCLPLPPGVTPHFDGPYQNAVAVTRDWLLAERKRVRAILAQ